MSLVASFFIGFLSLGNLEAQTEVNDWCWSADDQGSGGYFRCVPELKCSWVEDRVPEGEVDLCKGLPENQE